MIRSAVTGQHVQADGILPEMFADIGIALDIGVAEYRRVVTGWVFIDTVGEGPETGNSVNRDHILWAALPEYAADSSGHGCCTGATFSGYQGDHVLAPDMPTNSIA